MIDLTGKLVLVTGSTSGIGKAMAQKFLQAGASVILNGRSMDRILPIMDEFKDKVKSEK